MTLFFPALSPTSRTFTAGLYPVRRQLSPAGSGVSRRFGTSPIEPTLSLEFANITDANAAAIAAAFESAAGSFSTMELPTDIWRDLANPSANNSDLKPPYWRFKQPPVYSKSSIPGYKTVSVELVGDYAPPSSNTLY